MTATTITPESRKHFVFLFDLGVEYFNTCIAGDPREAVRSLEYPASVYHALHAKLSAVVHSDAELTADNFAFEGRELLGELVEMGAVDFDYMFETKPATIRERYTTAFGEDPEDTASLDTIHTESVSAAHSISFGH
ncbi:hypothetical protein [Brevibacterium sp. FME17]|uniref:hypothetical protein n=1 Tax=Brevibacterium sp. FME17 TaxID=2742606 RepID=UPI001866C07C|nr:hypothetical protein [Brevibacterium sp. FME17]